ncbi:hypothetical protein [Roseibium sp.]|uniref:hypothetical protein n=1 Tax=Roseibium sp. TaxID=1936156 RepID=UPI003A969DB6
MSADAKRHKLHAAPVEVLKRLPGMDRVMMVVRANGFVHERIGLVEQVEVGTGPVKISGKCHSSEINDSLLVAVELDTSSEMRGKVYPRLDFLGQEDEILFSVVGLEGLEVFAAALVSFEREAIDLRPRPSVEDTAPDLENDPARPFLDGLIGGDEVTVEVAAAAITQRWTGKIEDIRAVGGCFNILTKDFHLHLPAECFSGWSEDNGRHTGILLDGSRSSLTIGSGR